MKYSVGDICDRLSILTLKLKYLDADRYNIEYEEFKKEYEIYNKTYNLDSLLNNLIEINSRIWNLEADIRSGKEKKLGLKEVGRRAIQIRDINEQRVKTKNEINIITNTGFQEIKSTWDKE